MHRPRYIYGFGTLLVIGIGLASRSDAAAHLPRFLAAYSGDSLWALTVFLVLGFIFPKTATLPLAAAAVAISFSVEFSQLYQAPWINHIRQTLPGKLLLGAGFLKSDLLCYLVGIAVGVSMEILVAIGRKSDRGSQCHLPS